MNAADIYQRLLAESQIQPVNPIVLDWTPENRTKIQAVISSFISASSAPQSEDEKYFSKLVKRLVKIKGGDGAGGGSQYTAHYETARLLFRLYDLYMGNFYDWDIKSLHCVKISSPVILEKVGFPQHAEALRSSPGDKDWNKTLKIAEQVHAAILSESYKVERTEYDDEATVGYCKLAGLEPKVKKADRGLDFSFGSDVSTRAGYVAYHAAALSLLKVPGFWEGLNLPGTSPVTKSMYLAPVLGRPSEELVAMLLPGMTVLPSIIRRLGVLNFRKEPVADPDAYAVAWDALEDPITYGSDDGLRARDGVNVLGRPVELWERRTALARCVVRKELVEMFRIRGGR